MKILGRASQVRPFGFPSDAINFVREGNYVSFSALIFERKINNSGWEFIMNFGNLLHWAIVFLVVALIAGLLGFGSIAGTSMEAAKIVFWVAIVVVFLSFVFNLVRTRS